ncbi:hypothetical protein C7S16_7123 [Burkholderia thailandensis]|uniref:Uncharacterized protein n=1 Tax=Burkholderia thailandensis TaxID=57975 RepID=A0AAW9CX64_BURTH|nr:hypothetical protein [Burkholderia thailandensis]MDW9253412.1 hypothetical protein [Burkholderia thailandensis]
MAFRRRAGGLPASDALQPDGGDSRRTIDHAARGGGRRPRADASIRVVSCIETPGDGNARATAQSPQPARRRHRREGPRLAAPREWRIACNNSLEPIAPRRKFSAAAAARRAPNLRR